MPKILLALSVLFMIGSAYLGYLNKGKMADAVAERDSAKNSMVALTSASTASKASATDAREKLTAETAKRTELEQQTAAKDAEIAKAAADATTLNAELTDKTAALEAATTELNTMKASGAGTTPAGPPVPADDARIIELNAQIEALKGEKQIIGDKLVAAESKNKEMAGTIAKAKNAVVAKGLEGQVVAVNQAWGFVVLNLGDRSGVVNNVEMVVMRDGERVGRVKITSVEPSNSIADIVSSSVSEGQRVMPGDRVIYAGN